jgi:hypothetical protein
VQPPRQGTPERHHQNHNQDCSKHVTLLIRWFSARIHSIALRLCARPQRAPDSVTAFPIQLFAESWMPRGFFLKKKTPRTPLSDGKM